MLQNRLFDKILDYLHYPIGKEEDEKGIENHHEQEITVVDPAVLLPKANEDDQSDEKKSHVDDKI